MIYIGFGFLMVFLKSNSWTSVGWNFMLSAFAFQWAILCRGFWSRAMHGEFSHKIDLDMTSLINADFCAGACMITFGALLGKAASAAHDERAAESERVLSRGASRTAGRPSANGASPMFRLSSSTMSRAITRPT